MADHSSIEWTDATWSPTLGCTKVSPGCDNCYAMRTVHRMSFNPNEKVSSAAEGLTAYRPGVGPVWTNLVRTLPDRLDIPLRWRKPRRIFVDSQSDLFHEHVPDEFIARVFAVMAATPQHTYQILTKRHARMRSLVGRDAFSHQVLEWGRATMRAHDPRPQVIEQSWPLPNVWVGVSVEDQKWAVIRTEALRKTLAAVRFLSCEPLLGPLPNLDLTGIDWVICGGESGPGARPMHPDWARSLRDQCTAAGVPFHFKQRGQWTWSHGPGDPWNVHQPDAWVHGDTGQVMTEAEAMADGGPFQGVWRVSKKSAGRVLDGRTWDEYPTTQEAAR